VLPFWRNRSTLMPILKGLAKEPGPEVDPAKPIPYRMVWIGLIVSVVLTVAMGMVAKILPLPLLVFIIVLIVINMGYMRMYAETGGWYGVFETIPYHAMPLGQGVSLVLATLFRDTMWSHGATPTQEMALTVAFTTPYLVSGGLYYIHSRAGRAVLDSCKLGSVTRTNSKDMLKAVAIALGLGILVACIMHYVVIYTLGVKDPRTHGYCAYTRDAAGWFTAIVPGNSKGDAVGGIGSITSIRGLPMDNAIRFILGLAICLIVVFMRGRFTWFRISAAGIALGAVAGREIWSPLLLALVIKYLMIRMGGTKAYLEKLRPLSIGFFAGWAVMFTLGGVFLQDYDIWLWRLAH